MDIIKSSQELKNSWELLFPFHNTQKYYSSLPNFQLFLSYIGAEEIVEFSK